MENENTQQKSSLNKTAFIVIIIAIVIGIGFVEFSMKNKSQTNGQVAGDQTTTQQKKAMPQLKGKMAMKPQPTPPLTEQQKKELSDGTATSTTNKTFTIDGGNFYFVPNKITVNKGDHVTFVFKNDEGFHDLINDELNIKTPVIKTGKTATVTFTADKTGSFIYYCDVGKHKQMGMWGTLTVK